DWVPAFVDFHGDKRARAAGGLDKREMLVQSLDDRLCDEHVQSALDCFHRDGKMRVIWREDSDDVARLQVVHGCQICLRVACDIVVGETLKADIEIFVNAGNSAMQMAANAGELV